MQRGWRLISFVILCGLTLIAACSELPEDEDYIGTNVATEFAATYLTGKNLPIQLSSSLGGTAMTNTTFAQLIGKLYDSMDNYFVYPEVRLYKVTYSANGFGQLTGIVAVPANPLNRQQLNLPMISLQHPTQVLRSQSPSRVDKFADEELTVPYGMMLAAMGYIVIIPDYPGMGDNFDTHPYCMNSLGTAVAAMITATTSGTQQWSDRATWNGNLYLIGFSEGGYATLVTAKEMQVNHPTYNVKGVAALDGPYSLSETMRTVMLTANKDFTAPYFLPYVVAAYGNAYSFESQRMDFNAAVVDSPATSGMNFDNKLKSMLEGAYTGDQIGSVMKQAANYNINGPKSILEQTYIDDLNDTGSVLYQKLKLNDAFRDWAPTKTTLLYHNKKDDLVPFGNYSNARNEWKNKDKSTSVTYHEATDDLPGLGSVHAGSLIPAYIYATEWIDRIEHPERW